MQCVALHPLDPFRTFVALRADGQGDEENCRCLLRRAADREAAVETPLRRPALPEVYAEDRMTLQELIAFTANQDQDRQVQVWDAINSFGNKGPLPDPTHAPRGVGPAYCQSRSE